MANHADLLNRHCQPCKNGEPALSSGEATELLKQLDGWALGDQRISKTFAFKNYYQTIAFVNAVAWMTHREDHHPDMQVSYNRCVIEYSTHSVGGLSANDFICAAKVDALTLS
ncbi:MAG: 4a-hydroxytetrahydrobiopterin dehydratase [Gammaproteobacteria bacterium]|nr:4a-hydroxytetrahydrobiopterin dehydratase [Gammaproteobacteria bacterium]MBU1623864.1 4a-hydroxytetrahydrobiopterin dehydratase [Gammaproteobacteria bacterium]MBU1982081.1 4a-hydroxytetrahydrobiopterin dehydratase [Gammaproteobacteria bacterium]